MQTLKTESVTWHHILKPSADDLKWLEHHSRFHEITMMDLARQIMRPKLDSYDHYLYLVLHFPVFNPKTRRTHPAEVDFILTRNELITVTCEPIQPLDEFFKKLSEEHSLQELYAHKGPGRLLYHVMKDLYAFALRELDHIQENITTIEEKVFSWNDEPLIEELAVVRRDVIDFRRTMKPQQSTLELLSERGVNFFGTNVHPYFKELIGEYTRVWNLLENNKEAIDALYDNHVSVLNIRQNEAMKILAIMAFVTFPLMLFAALFSMDTTATPIIGSPNDFWIIVGIMILATFAMFAYFKRKKWL